MYNEDRNPFFEVKKEIIRTESGSIIPNKNALINGETGDVLGIVSPNYDVIPNSQINDLFENALSIGQIKDVTVSDHLDATTKRWKRIYTLADDRLTFEVKVGDIVNICLEVFNGYDGRTAYGYLMYGNRLVCLNGMTMGSKLFAASFSHYFGNAEKLQSEFELKFGMFGERIEIWKEWLDAPFSQTQFNNFIENDERKYIAPKVGEAIMESYLPVLERQQLPETKWGAFNVLTYLATHETKARKGSNKFSARHNNINRLANEFYEI